MAVVTKGDDRNKPASDRDKSDKRDDARPGEEVDEREEADEREDRIATVTRQPAGSAGFFTMYKPGQGYWTRLFTAIGSAVLLIAIASFLYTTLKTRTSLDSYKTPEGRLVLLFPYWKIGIVGAVILASVIYLWTLFNKPKIVDFFIATEGEMKKVNWTTRKDLIGSTKVVIFFMFLIAAVLFIIDQFFMYFFYLVKVLKHSPFE